MKRTVVTLVVLLCLFVIADLLLRAAAERSAAELVDESIEQEVDPKIGLGDFPFLWSLATGTFDEVTIEIPDASGGSLHVEDVRLTLEDVDLEALELLGGRANLRARSLTGSATVSERALVEAIGKQAPGVDVSVEKGRVVVSRSGMSVPATAALAANRLLMSADEVLPPIEIPLPSLLPGLRFSSLRPRPGELVFGITGSDLRFRI